jgi:hypothetical protein
MTAITTRLPAVAVEFDAAKGKRQTKKFADAYKARTFYTAQDKAGKNPKVTAGELPAEDAKPAKGKKAPAPAAESKAPKTPGVAAGMKTRAGCAGAVVAKYGLAAGVTDAMIAEVDKAYGRPNPTESSICTRNAFHAITAYLTATAK